MLTSGSFRIERRERKRVDRKQLGCKSQFSFQMGTKSRNADKRKTPSTWRSFITPTNLGGLPIDPRPTNDPPRTTFSSLMFKNQPLA